jgi:hypothetical protein
VTAAVAVPVLLELDVAVAFTVQVPAVVGAVKSPLVLIEPQDVDHVAALDRWRASQRLTA